MGLFFLFIFILWGWAEMSAFILIGGEIGGLLTLLGVFVTTIIGLSLLKGQGKAVMAQIRTDLAQGHAPVGSIADSVSLAVGGILMLIPGYVTDAVGVLLFIPGLRTIAGTWILHHLIANNRFKGFVHVGGQSGFKNQTPHSYAEDDDVIEGDVTEHTTKKNRLNNR
jgi:UPF0716 protein FxsA